MSEESKYQRLESGTVRRPQLILHAEDDAETRRLYGTFLSRAGFEVIEVANGREALDRAPLVAPDLILMDLAMPEMDGLEATRRLKADERTRHIPIVAMSAHGYRAHLREASAAGCDGYIVKPCSGAVLLRTVLETLETLASQQKAVSQ